MDSLTDPLLRRCCKEAPVGVCYAKHAKNCIKYGTLKGEISCLGVSHPLPHESHSTPGHLSRRWGHITKLCIIILNVMRIQWPHTALTIIKHKLAWLHTCTISCWYHLLISLASERKKKGNALGIAKCFRGKCGKGEGDCLKVRSHYLTTSQSAKMQIKAFGIYIYNNPCIPDL